MPVDFGPNVGRRVVLRYRLRPMPGAEDRAPTMTDALGILERFDDHAVVVRRRDGSLVQVDRADVLALKLVPPRPVPRRDMRALEQAAAIGWQPIERAEFGGWVLRAADGFTKRANSVLALADPLLPLPEMLPEIVRWYGARGLPPLIQVVPRVVPALDDALTRAGWLIAGPSIVLSVPVPRLLDQPSPPPSGPIAAPSRLVLAPQPSPAWLAGRAAGKETGAVVNQVISQAPGADLCFVGAEDHGEMVAVARGAVARDPSGRGWLGISALEVRPSAQRTGLATRLVTALAGWAGGLGAVEAYVQVTVGNHAALGLYDRLGFVEHHRYHYRRFG